MTKMKILDLPLKAKWYEMIERGEKREEYREIKPYWVKRLCYCTRVCSNGHWSEKYYKCVLTCKSVGAYMVHYTHVRFRYGYTSRTMTFPVESISVGLGNPEWGAPTDKEVFIIKLGNKLEQP